MRDFFISRQNAKVSRQDARKYKAGRPGYDLFLWGSFRVPPLRSEQSWRETFASWRLGG